MNPSRIVVTAILWTAIMGCGTLETDSPSNSSSHRPVFAAAAGSVPVIPASWTYPNWYIDPANSSGTASDVNTCTSSSAACLTFGEVLVHRLGTLSPLFKQTVTFTLMSAQSAGVDNVYFYPLLAGGAEANLIGTLSVKHSAFVGGAVTPKAIGGPGQLLTVAGFPAGVAAGDYVLNQTRNSYAIVDSVSGGTTAVLSQPIPAALVTTPGIPTTSEDNTWTTGDTFSTYTRPLVNLKAWQAQGGDVATNGTSCGDWVQWISIPDTSGTGKSVYPLTSSGCVNVLSGCQILTRTHISVLSGRGFGSYLLGSDADQAVVGYSGSSQLYAGILRTGFTSESETNIDGDPVVHGSVTIGGVGEEIHSMYVDGSVKIDTGVAAEVTVVWGPGSFTVGPAATYVAELAFSSSLLVSGGIAFQSGTNGYTPPTGGTFTLNGTSAVAVTGTFPAGAPIAWSLNTVGGTPGVQSPYFSAAQIANQFTVKSPTASANDTYNWQALPASVPLTVVNLGTYETLTDPLTGGRFTYAPF